ncbi:MAG: glutamate--cysteine ligase [Myxococcales bacterium]|nr:glutamate--cysteine ligase [Myxococcales bacterium]
MSLDLEQAAEPVTSLEALEAYFRAAERPRRQHRVGLEHEKLVYLVGGFQPVPYEGERGIGALLRELGAHGYEEFRESPELPVIALRRGGQTISLEPGGQLELSGAPAFTAREAHEENLRHVAEAKAAAESLGQYLVTLGYRPFAPISAMPWMPKSRYQVMRRTLGSRGRLALNMMLMTATGQVSLDWEDEADCARKVVAAARMTPVLLAMFANSPLMEGRPSGFLSFRSRVWSEVDPARCGYLPSMFDGSFGYRAYAEWALEAPLLFLRRGGEYLTPPLTFRQLLEHGFEGRPALYSDWVDHQSTMFPEVRIKNVMEIRCADCVSPGLTGGLLALMRGLFYEPSALAEAESLLPKLPFRRHLELHEEAQRRGLRGELGGVRLADLARELVAIARRGLRSQSPLPLEGEGDLPLLELLAELVESGRSPAERVLETFEREKDPAKVLAEFAV